jgi:hypothetical protein
MSQSNQKLALALKWGLGLAAAAVVAPVIFLTVKGLVGLAIAAVVGLAIINGAPVISSAFANWKMKGIKAVAAANPVEQLQNVLLERRGALRLFSERITDFATRVRQFESKLQSFKAQFPADAPKFDEQAAAMNQLLSLRRAKYEEVRQQLAAFELEVKKADAIWQMSQAAAELHKAAGMEGEDVYAKIKAETALESVELSLNKSFAQLESALMEENKDERGMVYVPNTTGSRQSLTVS